VRTTIAVLSALALVLAGCTAGGGVDCAVIVDEGLALYQDVIDDLDGKSLAELDGNPLEASDYASRARELERRTSNSECTDAEIADLLGTRFGELQASDSNPAGQAFIAALAAAVERGGFDFGE
jgi:hypothetical protein